MALTVLCCTDGSEHALDALRTGLAVVAPADRVVVATVIEPVDPTLVYGTGLAGGVVPAADFDAGETARETEAQELLDATVAALGLTNAETRVVMGATGPALIELAEQLPASVIVIGTRGHGGLRRAVLGSVSDYVVRHAPCPVVATSAR
jgi:nucleotide-binding universal stress UspA family protein